MIIRKGTIKYDLYNLSKHDRNVKDKYHMGITDTTFRTWIIKIFLGSDWIDSHRELTNNELNTESLEEILYRLTKKDLFERLESYDK